MWTKLTDFKCKPTLTINYHVDLGECSFVLIELVFSVHSGAGHQLPEKPSNLYNQESRVKWSRSVPLTCLQIRNSSKLGSLFSNFHFPTISSIVQGFMPRDQSSENPKGRMNGNEFTLTKGHLLWHCDISRLQVSHIFHTEQLQEVSIGVEEPPVLLVFPRFIYLSFFPADRDLWSFKTSGSTIS